MGKQAFEVGQRVACNGYLGTIVEVCTGQLSGMYCVRVPGGVTCVDGSDLLIYKNLTALVGRRIAQQVAA